MVTAETVRRLFDYDYLSGNLVNKGTDTTAGYIKIGNRFLTVEGSKYQAPRLVWLWHTGTMPVGNIKALNGDRLDTHIENLVDKRLRSLGPKAVHGKPFTRGVGYSRKRKQWKAYIRQDGKYINLGFFDNYDMAVLARVVYEEGEENQLTKKVTWYDNE